ncbi:hypothetical protein [Alicycliphilus denitrificans]|uniref:hypothetical protein n=1 Tax=Alicycliphilus denitrificans TaxID=179636 RepID=UPI00384D7B07
MSIQILPRWSEAQRMDMHAAFTQWLIVCDEQEYQRLMELRETVAPGDVCSIIKLVRSCYARPDLLAGLPARLVQLMRARCLPLPFADASAAAG